MADTFRAMIQRVEDAKGKTVTTEVELISYVKERSTGNSEARYYVKHSNQQTVLEQGMVINRDGFGNHQASIIITDFPGQKTPEEAALKLADWLKRLASPLRLISKIQRWMMPKSAAERKAALTQPFQFSAA